MIEYQNRKRPNYLKVDPNTIQGKITIGFMLMCFCAIVIGFSSYFFMKKALDEQREIINVYSVSKQVSNEVLAMQNDVDHLRFWAVAAIFCSVILTLFIGLMLSIKIINAVLSKLHKIESKLEELSAGELPEAVINSGDELQGIYTGINILTQNLTRVKKFAEDVGKGHFDSEVVVFNNTGVLGESLAQMRNSLKEVSAQDEVRNWTSEGIAQFAQLLRQNNDNLEVLCNAIIKDLIKYLKANQGALFITESHNGEDVLEMKACYAYERKKHIHKTLHVGEGLAGQAFQEGETIFLTEVPQNYFSITSGLGDSFPKSVLIVPLKLNETIMGVLEIASLSIFEPKDIAFVEKIAESIASTVSGAKVTQETQKLLEASMMNSEQMQAQEEELRQNLEEIQATQEQMMRQTEEMRNMQKKLLLERGMFHVLMEYTPDRITYKDTDSKTLRVNIAKAKRFNLVPDQMIGTTDFDFFPKEHAQKARNEEVELMKVGVPMLDLQEKVLFDTGEVMFINTSRIPFKDETGQMVGVCIISKDITKLKVQEGLIINQDKMLKGVLSQVPIFNYKVDRHGKVTEIFTGNMREDSPNVLFLDQRPIQDILPNFYIVAEENKNGELFKVSGEIELEGKKGQFLHYILADSIYKDVYWGFAVQQ